MTKDAAYCVQTHLRFPFPYLIIYFFLSNTVVHSLLGWSSPDLSWEVKHPSLKIESTSLQEGWKESTLFFLLTSQLAFLLLLRGGEMSVRKEKTMLKVVWIGEQGLVGKGLSLVRRSNLILCLGKTCSRVFQVFCYLFLMKSKTICILFLVFSPPPQNGVFTPRKMTFRFLS